MFICFHKTAGSSTASAATSSVSVVQPGQGRSDLWTAKELLEETGKSLVAVTPSDVDTHLAQWRNNFFRARGRFPAAGDVPQSRERLPSPLPMDGALRPVVRCERGSRTESACAVSTHHVSSSERTTGSAHSRIEHCRRRSIPQHERFLVLLLRWTGLRVGEAVSLAVSDVDLTRRREAIYVRSSKTPAGRRAIPVLPMLLPELRDRVRSISNRTGDFDAPILITRNGTAMKPTYVWRAVKRASFRAGVRVVRCECGHQNVRAPTQDVHGHAGANMCHEFRRILCAERSALIFLNCGVRLEVVSKFLGHASTSVTERAYAELLYDTARREVLAALRNNRELHMQARA